MLCKRNLAIAVLGTIAVANVAFCQEASFETVHRLIKPQADESHWMQIQWLSSVWQARQKAAAEGKPIFIWAGSGGGPVGVC